MTSNSTYRLNVSSTNGTLLIQNSILKCGGTQWMERLLMMLLDLYFSYFVFKTDVKHHLHQKAGTHLLLNSIFLNDQ